MNTMISPSRRRLLGFGAAALALSAAPRVWAQAAAPAAPWPLRPAEARL